MQDIIISKLVFVTLHTLICVEQLYTYMYVGAVKKVFALIRAKCSDFKKLWFPQPHVVYFKYML